MDMHLVAQMSGGQAWCCSLIAVEDQAQAVGKDMQPVV